MTKTITTLNSLLDTRRLLRSIRISTDKYKKEFYKIEHLWNKSGNRTQSSANNNIRNISEKIYKDSRKQISLLNYISIILKTHLYEQTNLNQKMQNQTVTLLEENSKLEKIAETIMQAFIVSTQPDTPLNTIVSDLKKKFSRELNVVSNNITYKGELYGVLTLKSAHTTDCMHCIIASNEESHSYKTFLNELPIEINNKNFRSFVSPSQAYKEIFEILHSDGIVR